jgi:hypothetical protein
VFAVPLISKGRWHTRATSQSIGRNFMQSADKTYIQFSGNRFIKSIFKTLDGIIIQQKITFCRKEKKLHTLMMAAPLSMLLLFSIKAYDL